MDSRYRLPEGDRLTPWTATSSSRSLARELSFDDRTGSILRQVPAATAGQYTDAFVAFLIFRGNLGTYIPNAHVKLLGLGVPTGY